MKYAYATFTPNGRQYVYLTNGFDLKPGDHAMVQVHNEKKVVTIERLSNHSDYTGQHNSIIGHVFTSEMLANLPRVYENSGTHSKPVFTSPTSDQFKICNTWGPTPKLPPSPPIGDLLYKTKEEPEQESILPYVITFAVGCIASLSTWWFFATNMTKIKQIFHIIFWT